MIGQMAIAVALHGFNDLGRSVIPIFFFDGSFSLPIFYFKRKNEENLSIRSLNFLQNAPSNSVIFGSLFVCAADSLIQKITSIVCLHL